MKVIEKKMDGLIVFESQICMDGDVSYLECYNEETMAQMGIHDRFVQDNQSRSCKGVLRGLHFQKKYAQAQIVRVIKGKIFDAAVNINAESPFFGQYSSEILSEENRRQFYMSKDYAHGFLALTDYVEVVYKCSQYYHPEDEGGIIYNDPWINIDWPYHLVEKVIVGKKDLQFMKLSDMYPGLKEGSV